MVEKKTFFLKAVKQRISSSAHKTVNFPDDQMPVEKSQKNIRVGPAHLDNYTVLMSLMNFVSQTTFTSSGDNY